MVIRNKGVSYGLAIDETIEGFIAPLDGDNGVITTRANKLFSKQHYMISEAGALVVRIESMKRQCGEPGGDGKHSIIFQWYIW